MQMLAAGRLPNPRDSSAEGASWCAIIENRAAKYAAALEQQNRNASPSQATRLYAELWSFIATHMLKVDPKSRSTAKECLEAGRFTIFKWFHKPEVKGQRVPSGRQHGVTDEDDSDDDSLPALPDKATHEANSEAGVTPDYALQKQHRDRMMERLRDFITSDFTIPASDDVFGWDPSKVDY